MSDKKNRFSNMNKPTINPAEHFISSAQPKPKVGRPPKTTETKQSVTLTLLPSVYQDIQKLAKISGTSASALIGELCEKYIEDNPELMELHDKVFNNHK